MGNYGGVKQLLRLPFDLLHDFVVVGRFVVEKGGTPVAGLFGGVLQCEDASHLEGHRHYES